MTMPRNVWVEPRIGGLDFMNAIGNARTHSGFTGQATTSMDCKHGPLRPLEEPHDPACALMWPLSKEAAADGVTQYHIQYDLDVEALECVYGGNRHYHLYLKD